MFQKRRSSVVNPDAGRSRRQKVADCAKILLDVAKESSDWFPPLKSALGGVNALIKHYEHSKDVREKIEDLIPRLDRFKQSIMTAATDGDPEETDRRNTLTSTFKTIEETSQKLLAKGNIAQFVNKGENSKVVAQLVERLQQAIVCYQVSQQQAIYLQVTNLTSSFDALLKLREKPPGVKGKLESVLGRLNTIRNPPLQELQHERRDKLFSDLGYVRDKAKDIHKRIATAGYVEREEDVLAVSVLADDLQGVLLEYQMAYQQALHEQNCKLIDKADLSVLNSCRRAKGAEYRHGNRRGCLEGTRESVLNEIESWTKDFSKSPVFWLNGLAGTGKSTIAQTVSERIFADGLLGASFFCTRDFEDHSNLHFIFPTLAFQLAHKYPAFQSILVPVLQSDPDVVHESLYNQMRKLIVEPLQSVDVSMVIVIDALDECKDEEPSSAILSVLGRFVEQIPGVKFFITGRPEPRIKTGFRLPLLEDATNVFVLHDVQPVLVNNDIRLFLKHELSELAQRRRLDGWPSDKDIDLLCHRAGGLFVYAAATVKFLDSRTHPPKRRLEVILNLPECTAPEGKARLNSKTTLDSLYTSIFQMAFGEEDPEVYPKVRVTIGAVVLLVNPLPPSGISELIGLDPEEVMLFLTLVQSLIALDEDFSQPVKPFHKSFPDFITDRSRCADTRFYVSPELLHSELAVNCLRVMNDGLERDLLSLPDCALNSEVKDLRTRINDRISVALQYACQFWHNHLAKTGGDVTDVVSLLRIFLEEKFLAWLEVVSVLGAARGAIATLEQLVPWLQEVALNGELLIITRDYFHFVTKFFELINVSATHIYHSALELAPFSSIVRRLYYHHRAAPLPRVILGIRDSWDQMIAVSPEDDDSYYDSFTWSPCGQFIAVVIGEVVEVRDPPSLELLSTLEPTTSTFALKGQPAYSPDGHSLAFPSRNGIIIWDIQTGGMTKEIECDYTGVSGVSLVWSLDGDTICSIATILDPYPPRVGSHTPRVHDVASGTTSSSAALQSEGTPHLWAHNKSFRIMTRTRKRDSEGQVVQILEIGSVLTRIDSFNIHSWVNDWDHYGTFSPTTYRISISIHGHLFVLDIRNSTDRLLEQEGDFPVHCFSSDGSFFAASTDSDVHIWKYTSNHYTPWREFQTWQTGTEVRSFPLQFSPTSSSISRCFDGTLQVWRFDAPPIVSHPDSCGLPFGTLSHCGTYMAAGRIGNSTVAITNPPSRTPFQFVDTDMEIESLALTGNILVVQGSDMIAAWRLTKEGVVDGACANGRADRNDSVWAIPLSQWGGDTKFSIEDQAVVIRQGADSIHAYHAGTGEVLDPAQVPPNPCDREYHICEIQLGQHYPHHVGSDRDEWGIPWTTPEERWVKDPQGKHSLWIPVEWRGFVEDASGLNDIATVLFELPSGGTIIIRF